MARTKDELMGALAGIEQIMANPANKLFFDELKRAKEATSNKLWVLPFGEARTQAIGAIYGLDVALHLNDFVKEQVKSKK